MNRPALLVWAVITLGVGVIAYMVGDTGGREARPGIPAPKPSASVSAAASASGAPPAPRPPSPSTAVFLPKSPDDVPAWVDPPGVKRDPDGEVCRSINTTCGGFYNQDRCKKGPKSWTALLTPGQVNCVVAAQGLLDITERVRWIQNCAPDINCQVPR